MATGKKSVLLYCDIIHTVEALTNEEAGILFKHYLRYINDLNPPDPDKLTKIVFEPIKQNLKRDLKKWEAKSERNSNIAKEGWIKRNNANASERIKHDAKHADKDTVTVKVTDTDKDIVFNNELKGKKFKPEDLNGLPEIKIGSAIELIKITKNVDLTAAEILSLWEIFKVQNLDGEKYYESVSKVYTHFLNWLQSKKMNNGNKLNAHSNKTAGAYELLDRLKAAAGRK